jgi:hypothetical protein
VSSYTLQTIANRTQIILNISTCPSASSIGTENARRNGSCVRLNSNGTALEFSAIWRVNTCYDVHSQSTWLLPHGGNLLRASTGPHNRPSTGPHNRASTGPHNRPSTGPHNRPSTGPHNKSTRYAKSSSHFLEVESSPPCSPETATCPYPEPDESVHILSHL